MTTKRKQKPPVEIQVDPSVVQALFATDLKLTEEART
jgi:hypothetical protein